MFLVDNKDADQTVYQHSLISILVIHWPEGIVAIHSTT